LAWLLNNETSLKNALHLLNYYIYVIPFEIIGMGSYTPLHRSLPDLEAYREIIL
jgi:hypothetical protein